MLLLTLRKLRFFGNFILFNPLQQVIIDYECLNSVLISCITGKDDVLDMETFKEILKIFINLVLWRKIRKDMIHTCCYLCDIGLMIEDDDINMMAIFCLSQLTENEKSHQFLIKTINPVPDVATYSGMNGTL
jgi:hypothetical protein